MLPPRFTLRWLMVAVAVLAVVAWGRRLRQISVAYGDRAVDYRARGLTPPSCVLPARNSMTKEPNWGPVWAFHAQEERRRQYYEDMAAKYERAARYPWLQVEPDPPEPPEPN